jgi:hypothetical protein
MALVDLMPSGGYHGVGVAIMVSLGFAIIFLAG